MDIRRQELVLFHEKSTLSPLFLPPRIPQPPVSPGFIFLFLPPRLRISAMGFFLSPIESALSCVAEGNLHKSILFPFLRGWVGSFLRLTIHLPCNSTTLLVNVYPKEIKIYVHAYNQTCMVTSISSVQFGHSVVSDSATPWNAAPQASLEPTQTHVNRIGDIIQPSHPLSSPSPPAFSLSQHQGLF